MFIAYLALTILASISASKVYDNENNQCKTKGDVAYFGTSTVPHCVGKCVLDQDSKDFGKCATSSCDSNFGLSDAKANCNKQGADKLCTDYICVPVKKECVTNDEGPDGVHCFGYSECKTPGTCAGMISALVCFVSS
jgi:hypothetical protein